MWNDIRLTIYTAGNGKLCQRKITLLLFHNKGLIFHCKGSKLSPKKEKTGSDIYKMTLLTKQVR